MLNMINPFSLEELSLHIEKMLAETVRADFID